MTEQVLKLLQVAGFFISVFGAMWVWQDAKRLRKNGISITPALWAILVFLLWLVSLPVYFLLRRFSWQRQLSPPREVVQEFE